MSMIAVSVCCNCQLIKQDRCMMPSTVTCLMDHCSFLFPVISALPWCRWLCYGYQQQLLDDCNLHRMIPS